MTTKSIIQFQNYFGCASPFLLTCHLSLCDLLFGGSSYGIVMLQVLQRSFSMLCPSLEFHLITTKLRTVLQKSRRRENLKMPLFLYYYGKKISGKQIFLFQKIWQNLQRFVRSFHQVQTTNIFFLKFSLNLKCNFFPVLQHTVYNCSKRKIRDLLTADFAWLCAAAAAPDFDFGILVTTPFMRTVVLKFPIKLF